MWTAKNRGRYDRSKLRYPSDLTDDEWAHVEPLIPPAKRGGNKRHVEVREVMNGIMYVLSTGCQWRSIPKDLPPRSTLFDYLDLWTYDGTLDRIHHALYVACREQDEREATTSKRKSSSAPMAPKDLCCLHAAGSSSARLPGSTAVEGSPKIGRTSIEKRWLSCASLQSASCSESFVIMHDVSRQTQRSALS